MALVKCKECGSNVSSKSDKCPICGYPLRVKKGCLYYFGVLMLISFCISAIIGYINRIDFWPRKNITSEEKLKMLQEQGKEYDRLSAIKKKKQEQEKEQKELEKEQELKRMKELEELKEKLSAIEKERQEKKQKEEFLEAIEENYQNVVGLYKGEKYGEVINEINKFITYNKFGYKDIEQLYKKAN